MKNDLTVQTLHAVVDFVVEESGKDACKMCAYCCDSLMPCGWKKRQGTLACREGIIEKFQIRLTEGGAK